MLRIAFDITPSGNVVPAHEAIYVGGAGDMSVTTRILDSQSGEYVETTVLLVGLTAGRLLPISVHRVNAGGTTATGLVGWR